ncbi:MAG: hypothetical protein NC313_11390 [Butyrivibrio sp.]|nr:hypothetical protein [Butyrivibrio sp.]
MKKKLSIILACIMVMSVLGGCGASFDAASYIKALLDNTYKNDSSEMVSMKIATAEEAAKLYEEGLDAEIAAMVSGMEGYVSAEQEEAYRQVFADAYAAVKYTVEGAEKQDDGSYIVTVTYEQMNVFEPAMEEYMNQIINNSADMYDATEAEMMEWLLTLLKDCIAESLKTATYDDPQTLTVKVSLVDNVWTPSESDLEDFAKVIFDLDDANSVLGY